MTDIQVTKLEFQPTPPLRGATESGFQVDAVSRISTNAPLAGGDSPGNPSPADTLGFQPTPPLRGATLYPDHPQLHGGISTNAPLAGGDMKSSSAFFIAKIISTNAPLAGGDIGTIRFLTHFNDFNQRPPCGGRPRPQLRSQFRFPFQPTPPLRGATPQIPGQTGMDGFQPTPPARGATRPDGAVSVHCRISTNAPCKGGDSAGTLTSGKQYYFNQRPLQGGGDMSISAGRRSPYNFNQRPLQGGRRYPNLQRLHHWTISTNAPCKGGDPRPCWRRTAPKNFNQRPPCGGRHGGRVFSRYGTQISTNAPLAGGRHSRRRPE